MSDITLQEALRQKDFDQIEKHIQTDAESFKQLKNYEQDTLVQTALRNKAFPVVMGLVEAELVTVDLFELDRWMGSFLYHVMLNTPFSKTGNIIRSPRPTHTIDDSADLDAESLDFFQSLSGRIENIDEPVENQTMLEFAISQNLPVPVLQVLVDHGCPADTYDHSENTLLFRQLTPQVGHWLVQQGLDVNHKNKGGVTPLEKAIDTGNPEWVRILLDSGADIHHQTKEGHSMFRFALVDKVDYALFDLLCEYDSPNFHQTNRTGSSLLFDYIDRLTSVSEKSLAYLTKLLEMGADVQQVNTTIYGQKKTPLDAAMAAATVVFEIVLNHYTEDINQTDNDGNTLLHRVCGMDLNYDQAKASDLYKKVKLLLGKGADPSIRNTQDKTAVDLAGDDNLKEKVVALLLKQ